MFRDDTPDALYFRRGVEPGPSTVHGLGMFATEDLPIHYCIEIAPILIFNRSVLDQHYDLHEQYHMLMDFVFGWPGGLVGVGLGYSSIYNHDPDPNTFWRFREGKWPALEFFTKREIKAGDEMCTRYRPNSGELPFLDEKEASRIGVKLK